MSTNNDLSAILKQRGESHGNFEDVAKAAFLLETALNKAIEIKPNNLSNEQLFSLKNQIYKMARIIVGNSTFKDHWVDISGYAKLIADKCDIQESINSSLDITDLTKSIINIIKNNFLLEETQFKVLTSDQTSSKIEISFQDYESQRVIGNKLIKFCKKHNSYAKSYSISISSSSIDTILNVTLNIEIK